jgi:aminopeptidase N
MRESQGKTIFLKDYSPPSFLIDETHLIFQLFEEHTLVRSRLLIRRNPLSESGDTNLILDGQQLLLIEILLDSVLLDVSAYTLCEDLLIIDQVPDQFVLEIATEIKPHENTSLEGLYKSKKMFCTQCEAEGFRKITYYLDRPDVLSSFTTRIEADQSLYPTLLSNGNCVDSGQIENGRHWVQWLDPFKKPSYLFALVAGDLQAVDDNFTTSSGRDIELRIFVEEKDLDKCNFSLISLKKAMRWDEEVYGREYDLDIFMIVAVDDFNMGAMENKGLNIFNSSCVLAKPETSTDQAYQRIEAIVAHEYFHNWSGNRVTCRDWFQLSLKEGFTVYRDSEFSADMGSRAVHRIEDVGFLRTVQFAEDAGPMAHSVRPDSYMEISNFYTVTIYEKGAEVVRMQANLLGPETFRHGTDLYFERFDGQAVTTEDFVQTMEEVSGLDLKQFRRWYTQAGTPILEVAGNYDADNQTYTLHVEQSCPPTPGQSVKEPFYIPLRAGLIGPDGENLPMHFNGTLSGEDIVLHVQEASQDFVFENVLFEPVPSLLKGFSAPVKLNYPYSRDELMLLMQFESDGFARWEASQQLALQVIDELLVLRQQGKALEIDQRIISAFSSILDSALENEIQDKAILANLLVLPTEAYLSELAEEIDVDGIHEVREYLRKELALALEEKFLKVYGHCQSEDVYQYAADEVARRSLQNTVINYLACLDRKEHWSLIRKQFEDANNMTDSSGALRAIVNNPSMKLPGLKRELLDHFYTQWSHETLVVEQWFAMQSAAIIPDNLPAIKALMKHDAFDIRNPNKVRSVIGAFCHNNSVAFHQLDGSGYTFLTEQVLTLNSVNPQIAARLLTPLTRWKKYSQERQKLMREALIKIQSIKDLSSDVFEVVNKSLQ